MKVDDVGILLEEIKRLHAAPVGGQPGNGVLDMAARLIVGADAAMLQAVQHDRAGALALVDLLGRSGQRVALSALLSTLDIARDDHPMLDAAIGGALGGAPWSTHQWMLDYDIPAQRLEMIKTCVLPFIAGTPGKQLFGALKRYEFYAIAANRPLLDADALHAAIAAARLEQEGAPPPLDSTALAERAQQDAPVRLLMPNEVFNVLLRLAWRAPAYLLELHERYEPAAFIEQLANLRNIIPVYLIPTHLGYPMGGGESFMHQTCRILCEFGVQCVWVSYLDPASGWYSAESVTYTPYYLDVRRPGGCSQEAIQREVDFFGPDLIHAQGGTNDVTMAIATESRLNTMIGYHFWSGLVELGKSGNRHILDNVTQHALTPPPFPQSRLIWKYVASEFMQQVHLALGGKEKLNVVHAVSDSAQYYAPPEPDAKYVLQINVCPLKGGEIFLESVRALGHKVPFMGVKSESDASDFFDRLGAEVARHPQSVLKSYGNVREFYRNAKMVIVPTLVDETFCRVAFEAAMNGIPVLSTANGFLPQMLGETGIFRGENAAEWVETIAELYDNPERLARIGQAQQAHLQATFGSDFRSFIAPAMNLIDNAATRSIGIFTVWGDLGLGNLCHAYAKLLRSAGYRVHIFSFQPYSSIGKGLVRQNEPGAWSAPEHADSVHYSYNCREEVTVYELSQFVLSNEIHTLLVPEVCWHANWNRLFALNIPKLAVCTIPMIEIVIEEEIPNHNKLTSTLYCTRLAERVLRERGVRNGAFLGHGFGRPLPLARVAQKRERLAARDKIRFLHVAGHNPTSRKNTPQILDAFVKALEQRQDIELTVTSMDPLASYYQGPLPPGITIVDRSIGHGELLDLYEDFDVSIQVSSHEGLGLGFYESTSRATPVLSLDGAPHNEVVREGATGWLIPARPMAVPDNSRSVVSAWRFSTADLTARIVSLQRDDVGRMIESTAKVFRTSLDEIALLTRFIQVLPSQRIGSAPAAMAAPDSGTPEGSAPPRPADRSQLAAVAPTPFRHPAQPVHGLKLVVKRATYLALRRVYHLARPVTRRLSDRLSAIVAAPIGALRHDLGARMDRDHGQAREVLDMTRQLLGDVRALAGTVAQHAQVLDQIDTAVERGVVRARGQRGQRADEVGIPALALRIDAQAAELGELSRRIGELQEQAAAAARGHGQALGVLQRETRHIKDRLATYAGPNVVLTYLRDESPLFVNTGDLGCPSPIINGGVWEPENLDVLFSFVRDDTVFLDIGANVGYFSVAIGNRVGKGGKVLAFEPHPVLVNLLERSIQLNSLERTVSLTQCALSDTEGTLDLYYPADHLGKGSHSRNADDPGVLMQVPCHTLDTLLPAELVVDLVKIDVEGHELHVLRGMQALLRRSPQAKVLFEKLDRATPETDAIGDLLRELGLALYGVGAGAVLQHLDRAAYAAWTGDVLAAPASAVTTTVRTGFSIYPGQLSGAADGRYQAQPGELLFFGPNWYLASGHWQLQLHGKIDGSVRVQVADGNLLAAELVLTEATPSAVFFLPEALPHFELRAFAASGASIALERIALVRCQHRLDLAAAPTAPWQHRY